MLAASERLATTGGKLPRMFKAVQLVAVVCAVASGPMVASAQDADGEVADTWVEEVEPSAPSTDDGLEPDASVANEVGEPLDEEVDGEAPGEDVIDSAVGVEVEPLEILLLPILLSENIDPVVGHHVSSAAIEHLSTAGYRVVDVDTMERAIRDTRTPARPSSAELWSVMFAAGAKRAAFFFVTAEAGQYVLQLQAASADGAGPFSGQAATASAELRGAVSALIDRVLPAPSAFDHAEAAAIQARSSEVYNFEDSRDQPEPLAPAATFQPALPPPAFARRPPAPDQGRRFEVALTTQAAFGIGDDFFYNHLVGVRAGVRLTRMWGLLLEFSYANLNGRDDREHSLLPILSVQARFTLSRRFPISLPVRLGVGYLFFNGPVVRASAGLNYALSDRFEIGLDVIAPIVWFRKDQETLASMTVGLEAIVRL